MNIRKANQQDLSRIGEIYVLNNRQNYYPVFQDEAYSFGKLQVTSIIEEYFSKEKILDQIYVYDDGVVKAFLEINENELSKLYVDPFFQNHQIGAVLIQYAIKEHQIDYLWALENNKKAIEFYKKHGFSLTCEKMPIEDTNKFVIKLKR